MDPIWKDGFLNQTTIFHHCHLHYIRNTYWCLFLDWLKGRIGMKTVLLIMFFNWASLICRKILTWKFQVTDINMDNLSLKHFWITLNWLGKFWIKMVLKGVSIQFYPLVLFQDFSAKVKIDGWHGCFKIIPFLDFISWCSRKANASLSYW